VVRKHIYVGHMVAGYRLRFRVKESASYLPRFRRVGCCDWMYPQLVRDVFQFLDGTCFRFMIICHLRLYWTGLCIKQTINIRDLVLLTPLTVAPPHSDSHSIILSLSLTHTHTPNVANTIFLTNSTLQIYTLPPINTTRTSKEKGQSEDPNINLQLFLRHLLMEMAPPVIACQ
jgi:hypothetical protein